jgi:hypothetical protein
MSAAAKPATTVNELAAALGDLDVNVSDEEISQARQLWLESVTSTENYVQIKTASHPMLA